MFKYHNENILGLHENDCVIRAITYATGLPYELVLEKVALTSQLYECDALSLGCYSRLLNDVFGFKQVNIRGLTAEEFAKLNPIGVFIVRMDGHLSAIEDGVIMDTFDCGDEFLTTVWRVV